MTINLTALLQKRAACELDFKRILAECESRGKVSADEQSRFDKLTVEIRDLDRQREIHESYTGESFGQELQTRQADLGASDNRSLGEVMGRELRSLFTTGGGAALVPTEQLPRVFDRLAETSVGLKSGFTVIPTQSSELRIPHLVSDIAAAFVSEGEEIDLSDPGLEPIIATPRKLAAITSMSNEILLDSNPKVLDLTLQNLLRALSSGLDLAFFEGDGTAPNLRGLKNVSGIQKIDMGVTAGAAFADLDPLVEAFSMLEQADASATAVVMHPRSWGQLLQLKEQIDSLKPLLSESAGSPTGGIVRSVLGVPVYLSSKISSAETHGTAHDASAVYVYQADQVVAVRREEARIEIDRSRYFERDLTAVRGVVRYALVVPNPKAVCRIEGVVPAAS
jgi:HK97 family phage major capsid protein